MKFRLAIGVCFAICIFFCPAWGQLKSVVTSPYTIDSRFWNDRYKTLLVNWIPHCVNEISDPNLKEGGIENFVQAGNKLAGRPYHKHVGDPWANAWVYNTVESMCYALMFDPHGDQQIIAAQNRMRQTLDQWIPIILSAQEPDGFLHTLDTLDDKTRWTNIGDHEGYSAGYFIEAAIANYRLTQGKDRRMYDAAKRLADCWCNNVGPAPKRTWYDGHEELEQALYRFANLTNEVEGPGIGDKYIALSKFLLDSRHGGGSYDQSDKPVTQMTIAEGHAVRAMYLYTGMTDIAMATGDPAYRAACLAIENDLVNKKLYLTGGVGSGETPEGFGPDYSLPNKSYCESCAACGELFFQHAMNLAFSDAHYADLYEKTIYNGILGDYSLDGKTFTYTNELDSDHERYLWHECPCCVGNFPRALLQMPTWMYDRDANGIYVNLFIGSTVNIPQVAGTDVQIVQKTEYPLDKNVLLIVNPNEPKEFTLHIRSPQRDASALYHLEPDCNGIASLRVNGQPVKMDVAYGYVAITRQWNPGDRVEMVLPMQVQRVHAVNEVTADRGRVALQYGPLVFNIESVDEKIDAALAPDAVLQAEWTPALLDGVLAIHSTFSDGSPLLAIPNYARNNRGGRSIVWLNESAK